MKPIVKNMPKILSFNLKLGPIGKVMSRIQARNQQRLIDRLGDEARKDMGFPSSTKMNKAWNCPSYWQNLR